LLLLESTDLKYFRFIYNLDILDKFIGLMLRDKLHLLMIRLVMIVMFYVLIG